VKRNAFSIDPVMMNALAIKEAGACARIAM